MSTIKNVTVRFQPSNSPDVVGYRLYMEEAPVAVSKVSQAWDLGDVTSIELSTLKDMITKDGVYNIGITAIDDDGNESSISVAGDVPLDFIPPDPPSGIVIERS